MRCYYKREKSTTIKICYCAAALLLVLGIVFSTRLPFSCKYLPDGYDIFSLEWLVELMKFIAVCVFIIWCGRISAKSTLNFRKWHCHLIENGERTEGKVEEIIQRRDITSEDSSAYAYQFRVSYVSKIDGCEKELITPDLDFVPYNNAQYVCDVYETACEPYEAISENKDANELIQISENRITFNINPFKLFRAAAGESNQTWFSNAVADNFRIMR